MILTPEQHLQIATVYEKAAADKVGVPLQQRAAFARKAKRFRMVASRRPKQQAALASKEGRRQHSFRVSAAIFLAVSFIAATAIRATMPNTLRESGVANEIKVPMLTRSDAASFGAHISTQPPMLTSLSPTGAPGLAILRTIAVPKPLPLSGVEIASMMLLATPLPSPPGAPGVRTLQATALPEPPPISGENLASMMLITTPLAMGGRPTQRRADH